MGESEAMEPSGLQRTVIYQTVSKRFENLREQRYKFLGIFAALVGALWYFAVQQIGKDNHLAAAVFLFASAASAACLHAMYRFRKTLNDHLDLLQEFEGEYALPMPKSGFSTNRAMTLVLWLALVYSVCGIPYVLLRYREDGTTIMPQNDQLYLEITFDDGTSEKVSVELAGNVVSSGGEWIPGHLVAIPTRCHYGSDFFGAALDEGHERAGRVQPEEADIDPDTKQPDWCGFTWLSNRFQFRPPFRAQSRPLGGEESGVEWRGFLMEGAVGKWPAGATVESLA